MGYHDGQLLATDDLRDDVAHETRMRTLHVRAMHGTWGIALGFQLLLSSDRKLLTVTQGMAYDCSGREILMSATLALAAPPVGSQAPAWWFDLLLRYDEGTGDPCQPRRPCNDIGPALPQETVAWRWSCAGQAQTAFVKPSGFAADVRLGEEIPLARVRVTDQGLFTDLDLTTRRVARALVRPHIVEDQVRQGSIGIQGSIWHWSAWIDTAHAGFDTDSPMYFVALADHPLLSPASGFAAIAASLSDQQRQRLLGPFVAIATAVRTGFRLEVRSALGGVDDFKLLPAVTLQATGLSLPVAVNWVGMEPAAGCQPPRASSRTYWHRNLLPFQLPDLRVLLP